MSTPQGHLRRLATRLPLLFLLVAITSACGIDEHRQRAIRRANLPGVWRPIDLPYRLGERDVASPDSLALAPLFPIAEVNIYGHDSCHLFPQPGDDFVRLRWVYDERQNILSLHPLPTAAEDASPAAGGDSTSLAPPSGQAYATLRVIPQDTLLYVGIALDSTTGQTLYKPFRRIYWF